MSIFTNKKILVTGSTGTVGSEIVDQLLTKSPALVRCIDNNESEIFHQQIRHSDFDHLEAFVADIRDEAEVKRHMRGVDLVLHAAALKHVGLSENSPIQAARTNVLGTQNLINAAIEARVEKFIFTSSDKAVNPTNVMGATKLIGERLIAAASLESNKTAFAATRFGNVLGSRGSVLPLFCKQIVNNENLTLTDRRMSRFVMTLAEATSLVLESAELAVGGEIFVTKMPVLMIGDLAIAISKILKRDYPADRIVEIGAKPGEKLFEELMSDEETLRSFDFGNFFVVKPVTHSKSNEHSYTYLDGCDHPDRPYNSAVEDKMSQEAIIDFLLANKLLKELA